MRGTRMLRGDSKRSLASGGAKPQERQRQKAVLQRLDLEEGRAEREKNQRADGQIATDGA
jgi:hypothetical protein